jgi:hypothetical protein
MKHQSGKASVLVSLQVHLIDHINNGISGAKRTMEEEYEAEKLELDPSVSSTNKLNMELDESLFGLLRTAVLIG